MFTIGIFQDEVVTDGTIESGSMVERFEVFSLDDVKGELESRYGGRFSACAAGNDGAFENSSGYGFCLVSQVLTK
jgi:hypothetical protein